MRGDGPDVDIPELPDFILETLRTSFELRKPDAHQKALEALRRAAGTPTARELKKLIHGHRNRSYGHEDLGPTPECVVHFRRRERGDTIESLLRTGALQWHHEAAALSIAKVFEAMTSALWARGAALERGRVDSSGGGSGIPERLAQLYSHRFLPWSRWMADPKSLFQACSQCDRAFALARRLSCCDRCGARRLWRAQPHLGLVLSIVVFGAPLEATAIAYRMRRERALRLLRLGLDRYGDFG